MDFAGFLERRGITLGQIVDEVRRAVRLRPGDILFLSGSLAEGLGNDQSDIDLILITDREDISFTSLSDVLLPVDTCVIEVAVKRLPAVDALIERFAKWSQNPRETRSAFAFNDHERKLLHRIISGQGLYGDDALTRLSERINAANLARHRLDWASHFTRNLQVDLAGFRSVGDYQSLLFAAGELLGHTIDALLAAHGYTNHISKWRARQLMQLPHDWETLMPGRRTGLSALDRYLSLYRTPTELARREVFAYALRIAAFARVVVPWAECRLLGQTMPALPSMTTSARPDGIRLPHLDLNVAVLRDGDRFLLLRLNAGRAVEISHEMWALLCLFDGATPAALAKKYAGELLGKRKGPHVFDEVTALVRHAELQAVDILDNPPIRRVLTSRKRRNRGTH